jgi:hypothetical protein
MSCRRYASMSFNIWALRDFISVAVISPCTANAFVLFYDYKCFWIVESIKLTSICRAFEWYSVDACTYASNIVFMLDGCVLTPSCSDIPIEPRARPMNNKAFAFSMSAFSYKILILIHFENYVFTSPMAPTRLSYASCSACPNRTFDAQLTQNGLSLTGKIYK